MPLQATSGAASYDAFGGGAAAVPNYIESVFSTTLYTGNGSTQTITNGIDLAGEGGLVWCKDRTIGLNHALFDTARGVGQMLQTDNTGAQALQSTAVNAFNSNGFTTGSNVYTNNNNTPYPSWTFRKQPKFFDVVTYTGNGVSGRLVSHNLGSTPGCVIIKKTSASENWAVAHRGDGTGNVWSALSLNSTAAGSQGVPQSYATSTTISVTDVIGAANSPNGCNTNGASYVMYLFAHDAGGFGLTGTDNVISCGSYTGNGSATGPVVTLGYEPQWVLIKRATGGTGNWGLIDNMRGFTVRGIDDAELNPNLSAAEGTGNLVSPTATGFDITTAVANYNTSGSTYIYIAIRRGPMKVPTTGTSVFAPVTHTTSGSPTTVSVGFPTDLSILKIRNISDGSRWVDRLRGITGATDSPEINSATTSAEYVTNDIYNAQQTTFTVGGVGTYSTVLWNFRRAPSYFDEVCYTGDGVNGRTITHNLAAAPELLIVKRRAGGAANWNVGAASGPGWGYVYILNSTGGASLTGEFTPAPTSSVFSVSDSGGVNASGSTYVAYLFASAPGVSKVGSYTGTGTTQVINCGFTAGSRFVLIKRTDSTGAWYVWDSARGIVAGNDPYLLLNSGSAEVTSTDYVDTYSAGFEISSTAPAAINASGGTFIFLAIA